MNTNKNSGIPAKIIGFCKHKTAGWYGVFYYGPSERQRNATAIFVASRILHWPVTKERAEKLEPVSAADFPLEDFIFGLEKTVEKDDSSYHMLMPSNAYIPSLLEALKDFKQAEETQSSRKFITDGRDVFEVVDTCWPPYRIWNIGENMIEGYLPLCRPAYVQPFPGGQDIDPNSLKAVRIDGAQTILKAVRHGLYTAKDMETFISRYKDTAKPGSSDYADIRQYEAAIPLMKQVKGL